MDDIGPALVCVGQDVEGAAALARQVPPLLRGRRAQVVSAWHPARVSRIPLGELMHALRHATEELDTHLRAAADDAAGAAAAVLRELGWQADARAVRADGATWSALLAAAEESSAGVVVAASAEHELPGGALGSQARALVHHCKPPLVMLPPAGAPAEPDAPALVAYDASPPAKAALAAAVSLLMARRAVVATAWSPLRGAASASLAGAPAGLAAAAIDELDAAARAQAEAVARQAAADLTASGWPAEPRALTATSSPWPTLAACASAVGAAVVVCGSRGHSRLASLLLGSVAEGLLRHAGRPVLVVRPPRER
jgi:nucleotide-binding universal stress UspA family protein